MDFLRDIFGAEALTYDQLTEKLKGNDTIKIANIAGGAYVGKDKFAALETERNGLREQLKVANTKLEGYDPEWKAKADKAQQDAEAEVAKLTFNYKLDGALAAAKVRDSVAVKAHLKMDALKVDGEKILGLQEQLDALKKGNSYLFDAETTETVPKVVSTATGAASDGTAKDKANSAIRQVFGKE